MADVTEAVEQSWPVEEKPLPGSQWAPMMMGLGNGILDQGGFPYRLVFGSDANATNQGTLRCPTIEGKQYGAAILEGFFHKYTADMVLDFPAVTKTTRYYVVLRFDPIAVTEGGLPVSVDVIKSLDYTSGKNYLHLYNVDREPNELLTDATVRMIRPRVAPTVVFAAESDMPQASKCLWGTHAIVHGGRNTSRVKEFIAINTNASGEDAEDSWWWKPTYDQTEPEWESLTLFSGVQWAGHGQRPQILRDGNRREIRGRISRTSGNFNAGNSASGDPYFLTTIPSADRPQGTVARFGTVSGNATPGFARIELNAADGSLTSAASKETAWVGVDGISWYVN